MPQESGNIWRSLLSTSGVKTKLPDSTLVLIGDRECGKSMLIKRFQSMYQAFQKPSDELVPEVEPGGFDFGSYALSHSYFTAYDGSRTDTDGSDEACPKVGVWALGDARQKCLLQFAVNPKSRRRIIVGVCVDFTKPWQVMDSLTKWLDVNEEAPVGNSSQPDVSGQATAAAPQDKILIVIGCKVDAMASDRELSDNHLDCLQAELRKTCLQHNAALFYTSAKKGINCSELYRYILGELYPEFYDFAIQPQLIDRQAIIIPRFFDSLDLISKSILNAHSSLEHLRANGPPSTYEGTTAIDTHVESDGDFLDKLLLDGGERRASDRVNSQVGIQAARPSINTSKKDGNIASNESRSTRSQPHKDVKESDLASFFSNLLSRSDQKPKSRPKDTGK